MMHRCLAGVLLFLCAMTVWPQAPVTGQSLFRLLDIKDGLPSLSVNAIAQDRTGYLWVGTKDGLARFDGGSFKVFRHIPGDPQSMPSNFVQTVHVDGNDRLWVGIEGFGVYRFDSAKETFKRLDLMPANPDTPVDVWAIASDPRGSVWFGSFGQGLFRLKPDGRVSQYLPGSGEPGLPDENVLSLAHDRKGQLWIATSSGIVQWKNERFQAFNNDGLSSKVVISLMPDSDSSMWLGTQSGLDHALPDGRIERPAWNQQLTDPRIMALLAEPDGARWFVARNGLNRLMDGNIQQSHAAEKFISAFQDGNGGFWFGSENGLYRQPSSWRSLKSYPGGSGADAGLRNKVVQNYHDLKDGSVLLVGKSGAIDRFWPDSGRVQAINSDASAKALQSLNSVVQDRAGSLWLGNHQGLIRFGPEGGPLRLWTMHSAEDPALLGPVMHLMQSTDSLIWAVFYGGGIQARDMDGRIVHAITPKSGHGLRYPDPEQLFIGPDGRLWLAGGEGLLAWNERLKKFAAVRGAPNERVFSVYFSEPQTLWLGGLGRLDAYQWRAGALHRIRSVGGDQGLPAVEIIGINADSAGTLWLTSARGLMRYSPVQDRVRVFGINDGLVSQEFAALPPYIGIGDRALALSSAGLVGFSPRQMSIDSAPLRLVVERVSARRDEDTVQLDAGSVITLQPGDRDLTINALLLHFDDVSAHRYRSRLSGYDPDWVEMGATGRRVFSRLPDGNYRLELIAAGADGIWSEPVVLAINVLPPPWKTWWAFTLAVLVVLLAVWLMAHAYRRRLKRKYAQQLDSQQRELVLKGSEAKSQFLADLGHEIRTPMTGVLGMTELLLAGDLADKPKSQVVAIKKAGEHLLRLMNDALDLSKIEAGQFELDLQPFRLHTLLHEVQMLLQPLAEKQGLDLGIQIEPEVDRMYVGDCGRIRQILLNLGNNAVKFTAKGSVTLKAQRLWPKGVMLSVVDTGPGMSAEQQQKLFRRFVQADGVLTSRRFGGSGLGLAISRELALQMAGDIQLDSEPGRGSTFTVNLPLAFSTESLTAREPQNHAGLGTPLAEGIAVLLVEDDETVVQVVSQLLAIHGIGVSPAKNALEALAQTAQHRYDIIFCDVDLPGMSGLELSRLWRSQGLQTPIVALTARTQGDAEALCLQAGMNAFLRKPVTGRQLQEAIAAWHGNQFNVA